MFNARYFQARYFQARYFNADDAAPSSPPDSPPVTPDSPPVEVVVIGGIRGGAEIERPAIVAWLHVTERPDRLIARATVTVKEFDDAALDADLLAIVMLT